MVVNDDACFLVQRVVLASIASKLAPTKISGEAQIVWALGTPVGAGLPAMGPIGAMKASAWTTSPYSRNLRILA